MRWAFNTALFACTFRESAEHCLLQQLRQLGEEVADGLLAAIALMLSGRARGAGMPRRTALQELASVTEDLLSG